MVRYTASNGFNRASSCLIGVRCVISRLLKCWILVIIASASSISMPFLDTSNSYLCQEIFFREQSTGLRFHQHSKRCGW